MPGRQYNGGAYRYGFNGMEKDDELKGSGNSYDFGARMYASYIGRWMSVDNVKRPWSSPYLFGSNSPVNFLDPDGNDEIHFYFTTRDVLNSDGTASVQLIVDVQIIEDGKNELTFFAHDGPKILAEMTPNSVSSVQFFPFEPKTTIANRGSHQAWGAKMPLSVGVLGANDDHTYLGLLLKAVPQLKDTYSDNPAYNQGFIGCLAKVKSMDFAEQVYKAEEVAFYAIGGYQVLRGVGQFAIKRLAQKSALKQAVASSVDDVASGTINSGGAARAAQYSKSWESVSLKEAIDNFAPGSTGVRTTTGKTIYKNADTGMQVVADDTGNYFRIENTKLSGNRNYSDLNGSIPNNKTVSGKVVGRTQAEYNQATHFKNSDL